MTVSGTLPYDNAPGAWRNTMAEMDSVPAPYGDIQALYPNHCFVPTISALDLSTDLFYAVAADTNRLAHTPYDAIYWADTNHEHVLVTPQNAAQMLAEITGNVVGVGSGASTSTLRLAPPWPSPSAGADIRIAFDLPRSSAVTLRVFDVRGRLTRRLWEGNLEAGPHQVLWDGRDETGRLAPAGIYFVRLQSGGEARSASVVRLR